MTTPNGYIFYEGPSAIDGAPIVVIATGFASATGNRKTGDMVQTYIIRQDVKPTDALRTGQDASICGDCKHRPILGGRDRRDRGQGPQPLGDLRRLFIALDVEAKFVVDLKHGLQEIGRAHV